MEPLELNIFPMMNLMVVLVPLLLSTATAIKIGVIELNLPQAVGGSITETKVPTESMRSLDLTITITSEGFFISSSIAILKGGDSDEPTISKFPDGNYDYDELGRTLYEIKQKIAGKPHDTKKIILQAESDVQYQVLVSTMDASRSLRIEENQVELFPQVIVSAGLL